MVLFLCLLMIQPDQAMEGARTGLLLWYQVVLPAQLPFMVGVKLLFRVCSFRRIPAVILNFLMGLVSGYPVGTMTAVQLYQQGRISRCSLTPLAAACNMAGPLFVIGTVGSGLLGNVRWGYWLLLVHWLSAGIMTAVAARRNSGAGHDSRGQEACGRESIGRLMGDAVGEAAELMLKVGGFIVIFSVMRQWLSGGIGALLEMTGGVAWLAAQSWDPMWILTGVSFLINFSGVCILMQSLSAADQAPVSTGGYIGLKLLQGLLAAVLMLGICQFLNLQR